MNNRCSDAQINWLVIAKNQTRNRELLSPSKRRAAAKAVVDKYRISERRACRIIGQPRSSQRYKAVKRADEDGITAQIVELASTYGRYGYRMITAMLHGRGYHINHKGVYRIWRTLGGKSTLFRTTVYTKFYAVPNDRRTRYVQSFPKRFCLTSSLSPKSAE